MKEFNTPKYAGSLYPEDYKYKYPKAVENNSPVMEVTKRPLSLKIKFQAFPAKKMVAPTFNSLPHYYYNYIHRCL